MRRFRVALNVPKAAMCNFEVKLAHCAMNVVHTDSRKFTRKFLGEHLTVLLVRLLAFLFVCLLVSLSLRLGNHFSVSA